MPLTALSQKNPYYPGSVIVFQSKLYRIALKEGTSIQNAIWVLEYPCGRCTEDTIHKLEQFSGLPALEANWRSFIGSYESTCCRVYIVNEQGVIHNHGYLDREGNWHA